MITEPKVSILNDSDEGKVIPFTPAPESPTRARRRANVLALRGRGLVPLAMPTCSGSETEQYAVTFEN